ncbi:MAG: MlaD family protein [Prevotellaceae bacterium]|nr:MlaD family protein [Prevotellaceae bacterium]MDY3365063.1 MlaD family protein [Prevotella sp.]
MKMFTKEIKIALVAILATVILFLGINFLKGLTLFSNDNTYQIVFKDISGLSSSTPVYSNGYKVGVIKDIVYNYEQGGEILVSVGLDKRMGVPVGSVAEVESDFMGNVKVNLILSNNTEEIAPGGIIMGRINKGTMGEAAALVPEVQKILPKLDSIMGHLNTLLANPAIAQTVNNTAEITTGLKTSTQELNTLLAGLNKNVPAMMGKTNGILDNTQKLTAELAAVDVQTTLGKVNETLNNVQQMTEKLNSNDGTLGLLMRDASLYNNLNRTLMSADSLLVNFRLQPKRYVHFSVFGKKDNNENGR